jgi:hypothetical protein
LEISQRAESKNIKNDGDIDKIIENLNKIIKTKRPIKRATLKKHINTLFGKKKTDQSINDLIDKPFIDKYLSEENGNLRYDF